MLKAVFTLDYEIHGNGEGSPFELMVEPTRRMLDQFDRFGAKLTIMADVAEILKFGEYRAQTGRDDYGSEAITNQLQDAVRRGHDVQLHLHCSYFNARCEGGRWIQDWSEYNFAALEEPRMHEVIRRGKEFLEETLRAVNPAYRCFAFRAANWAVSPSRNVVRALLANDFQVETSVFKYGRRQGIVSFDYTHAPSNLLPWKVDEADICQENERGKLVEFPIYSERRWVGAFLTPQRLYRALLSRRHRVQGSQEGKPQGNGSPGRNGLRSRIQLLTRKQAWKADFNQCSGRQLIRALERAERTRPQVQADLPFVLIGHSKLFTRWNELSLHPFLACVRANPARFGFATFGQLCPEWVSSVS